MAAATARIGDVRYVTQITTGRHELTADEPDATAGPTSARPHSTCCWPAWAPARP